MSGSRKALIRHPAAAVAGILGPSTFLVTWAWLGRRGPHYDPRKDPISRLAAMGTETRPAMNRAFLVRALGVTLWGTAGGQSRSLGAATIISGCSSAGLAALPLGAPGGDLPHVMAAAVAYAALVAAPAIHAAESIRSGQNGWAMASATSAGTTAVALSLSLAWPGRQGLFQRIGITSGDAWLVARALASLAGS
jgi:hypothetical membrane protein